jgi:carboxylesterase type B
VLDLYGHKADGDQRPLFSRLGTDYIFMCPSRSAAWAVAATHPAYLYRFNHTLSFPGAWGPRFWYCDEGVVCHGSEVPFVFHSHAPFDWTPEEEMLSRRMVAYWTNFAKFGAWSAPACLSG